ncbi:unnamed protein product [Knipowitschia caucasica]
MERPYHRPASRHDSPHRSSSRHTSPHHTSPHHGSPRSPQRGRWSGPPPGDSVEGDFYDYEPPAYEQSLSHPRSPRTCRPPPLTRRVPNGYRSSSPSPHRHGPPGAPPHHRPHPRGPRKGLHEPYSETDEDDWC